MAWIEDIIQKVWETGKEVNGYDRNIWRKDECGAWIRRQEYDNRKSLYGWEIDHINPNNGDQLSNLRPLHWENKVDKSDGRLKRNVTAEGNKNIKKQEHPKALQWMGFLFSRPIQCEI